MQFTRRQFMRGGAVAFTVGFAAPAFLSDLARAQGAMGGTWWCCISAAATTR